MAVPSSNSHLKNTTGGAFTTQTQGGTLFGNGTTGSVITKAFLIKDSTDADIKVPLPVERASYNGMYGTTKALSSGTFAYSEAGKYVIRTISTTLSGVASDKMLIPGSDTGARRPIYQFIHDFGVRLLAKWRANQFSWTGVLNDGTKIASRLNWLNSAGDDVEAPATLTNLDPFDPVAGSTGRKTDSAANPTRTIPGELVMKVDFVDTSVATGGDFFDYKPITGM
jgi:hypothetical protein